jgi:DNA-binding MurR/RpiR family transcriptional regulator
MTVRDRIDQGFDAFSASERRIAKLVAERYPVSALGGIEELAAQAGVSPPTVTRFVRRLGFARFADFQRAIRLEVQDAESSPLALLSRHRAAPPERGLAADLAASLGELDAVPAAPAIARAADLIAACRGRVFTIGGRWSSVAAQYLAFQLGTLRGEVHALTPPPSGVLADRLVDLTRRDVVVMFDFRRYQEELHAMAGLAAKRGARLVLVTDPTLSPVCAMAEVCLPVPVATASPLDTLTPTVAALDMLLARLVDLYGDAVGARMEALEAARGAVARVRDS